MTTSSIRSTATTGSGTRAATAARGTVARAAGLATAGLTAAALLTAPAPALAHDTLTGSTPADGASTGQAPQEVELSYSSQPQDVGLEIQVTGPDGADVTDGEPEIEGTAVTQELSEAAEAPGEYSVVWRVVSSDGHPIEGAFDYTVYGDGASDGASESSESAPAAPSDEASSPEDAEDGTEDGAAEEAQPAGESDTAQDQGTGTAVWLMIGGAVVLLGAVAAAIVMMRRMSR